MARIGRSVLVNCQMARPTCASWNFATSFFHSRGERWPGESDDVILEEFDIFSCPSTNACAPIFITNATAFLLALQRCP